MSKPSPVFYLLLVLTLETSALAGGFAIPHQTAKGVGLSNAVTAGVDDPSAVYVNPAALTEVEGNQLLGGLNYINTVSGVANSDRRSTNKHDDSFIPTLFANYHIPGTDLSAGIGLYSPFGLATTYDENSFTRFGAIRSELRTIFFTPAVAWQIHPTVSIGGGVSFVHSAVLFSRRLFLGPGAEGRLRLTDTDNDFAYNLGVLYKPTDNLKIGFTYRGRADLDFDTGKAKALDAFGAPSRVGAKASPLALPPFMSLGINYQLTPAWSAEFVYDYTRWREFRHLRVVFSPALLGGALPSIFLKEFWKDTHTFRLGTAYRFREDLELRGGIALDETPIPGKTLGPSIPGADILTLNAGIGYKWKKIGFDVAYMAVFYKTRNVLNDALEGGNPANPAAPGRDKYQTFMNFISFHLRTMF